MRKLTLWLLVMTLSLSVVAVACSDDGDDAEAETGSSTGTDQPAPSGGESDGPSITLLTPSDGDSVSGPVDVEVEVEGLTLNPDAIGGTNVEGEGHWHLLVDGELAMPVGEESASLEDLTPGEHTITVELHNNDHSPVTPRVADEATVTVE
jgi:hypothetical protein